MKKLLLAIFIGTVSQAGCIAQKSFQLFSPDSSLKVEILVKEKLSWFLYGDGNLLTKSSSADLLVRDHGRMSDNLSLLKYKWSQINETITVPVPYRKKFIGEQYNQLEITFKSPFTVQFRMYNEGMAFRAGTRFNDSVYIENEEVTFELNDKTTLWYAHLNKRQNQDEFHTSFEAVYGKEILHDVADKMLTYSPVTVSLPDHYHLAISDANLVDYPGMFLQKTANGLKGVFAPYPVKEKLIGEDFPQYIVTERASYIAKTKGTRMLPWRAVLVARKDTELPVNDLLYVLGDKPQINDVSWIKYGKGTDEWITGINLFNVPFKAGINTASYKYYIDFAKRFGFDQVMLDAGWSDVKDLFKVAPDINMPELLAYAKQKNIRLMLWTLSSTLDRQLDSALQQFNHWGISSIMTDFMDRDDQEMVRFYHRIAKACAAHKIAIMFHGAFPPKGINRTWPNIITHEGVLGSEWNIWSDLATPEHDVAIAYTRMLAGPLDYEPGLLLNAPKDQFRPVAKNPMSIGTRCHQLAMFLVYDSPLQIFSGNISQGLMEPQFMELLGSVPTTWDQTRILQGRIGEFIITARKKENDWFIAGLNNSIPRKVSFPLDFPTDGVYEMTYCKDGLNADNYGADYVINVSEIRKDTTITFDMAAGGGFLIRLRKK